MMIRPDSNDNADRVIDVAVIGAGASGMAAAIFAQRVLSQNIDKSGNARKTIRGSKV